MRMKTKRILKRAVPIVMAVIMILGVIGSAMMSMMTAHADETGIHAANSPEGRAKKKYNDMNVIAYLGAIAGQDVDGVVTFENKSDTSVEISDFRIATETTYFTITPDETSFTVPANGEYDLNVSLYTSSGAENKTYQKENVAFICDGFDFSDSPKVMKGNILVSDNGRKPSKIAPSKVYVSTGEGDTGYTEIEGSIAKPRMDIKIASSTPTTCKEGDTIDVIILLTYYKDRVSLQGSTITVSGDNFSVINGMVSRNLQYESYKYSGKESYTKAVRYQLQTKKDLVSGYYPVNIKIEYFDDEETKNFTAENSFNVYIEGSKKDEKDEDDKKTDIAKPYLIVEQYEYKSETGNDYIMAGETFSLKLSIKNTSNILPVENILVTLTEPEQFTLTSSSNTIYMDRLGAGGSIEKEINVRAKSNAPAGSHAIKLDFTYQYIDDEVRKDGTSTENIAIPIIQRDRFEVGEIEPPMMMYVGEESGIELTFVNKGTTEVRNITAVINGNIQNPGQSQYVGNLPAGEESSVNFAFSALEPGTVKAFVTLSYEDSNDIQREVVKEFTVEAQEMPKFDDMGMGGMDPGMMEPMEQESHMPVWGWIAIVVGGAAVVVVIIIIIRKKRKAKKAQEDDDEDI